MIDGTSSPRIFILTSLVANMKVSLIVDYSLSVKYCAALCHFDPLEVTSTSNPIRLETAKHCCREAAAPTPSSATVYTMTDPNSSSFSTFFPSSSPSNNNSTANREEIKKSYFQLKFLLKYSFHSLTNQDKKQFLILEEKLKELLLNIPSNRQLLSPQQHELILQRRKNLDLNIELKEIFSLFWLILSKDIQKKDKKGSGEEQQQQVASDGEEGASLVLSKFHYIQFHILLQLALIGNAIDENETKAIAEADYRYDTMLFGPINEVAFFDMMISLIGKNSSYTLSILLSSIILIEF